MGAVRDSDGPDFDLPVLLDGSSEFPDPHRAGPEGLVAVGGDFSVSRLLSAYRRGIFPWTAHPITWWSPDPRGIMELDGLHVPRSLARVLRSSNFSISLNRDFRAVIQGCAERSTGRGRGETWITPEFVEAYCQVHREGHAHSLEVWAEGRLVGGIYGVAQGGLFAGESMFHRVSNASKVALVRLVEHLRQRGFLLFDIQMLTPVTRRMGGTEISRDEYLQRLSKALRRECSFA